MRTFLIQYPGYLAFVNAYCCWSEIKRNHKKSCYYFYLDYSKISNQVCRLLMHNEMEFFRGNRSFRKSSFKKLGISLFCRIIKTYVKEWNWSEFSLYTCTFSQTERCEKNSFSSPPPKKKSITIYIIRIDQWFV